MSGSIPGVAIFVAKAGTEAEVETLLASLVEPSRGEKGVVSYTLHRDRADPRRFVFTEEWESQRALDAHVASAHVKRVFETLPDLLESQEIIFLHKL